GSTLLITFSTHHTTPWRTQPPYDAVADFRPVARLASTTLFMVTGKRSPLKTVADVITASRQAPGSINYGSAGQGTPSHMSGALLASMAGIEMTHAPYRNGSQALVDTVNGQVHVAFSGQA